MEDQKETIISIRNLTIRRDGMDFLKNITLTIEKGDFVYLVGKTGSGKSTFLETLYADIEDIYGDEAMVAGFNILDIPTNDIPFLRRKLGIAFQDFQLLMDRTVDANLDFAMRAIGCKDKEMIANRKEEVLNLVGLPHKKDKMPATLSDGEKQRIVIARAIINKPEIILADEHTGSLDPETSKEIMKLLFRINKENGTTILMSTHAYQLFREFYSPKILKCEQGKIEYSTF